MTKKTVLLATIALISLALIMGVVSAQQQYKNIASMTDKAELHEEMETLMGEGTYADLEQLREKYNHNFMPGVGNEDEFELKKQMHERMDGFHNKGDGGMMRDHGLGSRGTGCLMGGGL